MGRCGDLLRTDGPRYPFTALRSQPVGEVHQPSPWTANLWRTQQPGASALVVPETPPTAGPGDALGATRTGVLDRQSGGPPKAVYLSFLNQRHLGRA